MSERRPFFSIVIPTTRPHYLKYSLSSVLAQTLGDFEVIIAFNPPSENTELRSFPDDARIKVVNAPTFLPMHENWENGFRNINGQWAMLLGDDDCLIPQALETIAAQLAQRPQAKVLLWRWGGFVASDWPSPERGRVFIPPFSGKVEVRSSRQIETMMYGFDPNGTGQMKKWLPSIMRGAVSSDIVRQAQKRTGYFCHPLTPDYGAAAQIVRLVDEIFLLDAPLLILNHPTDSMTAAAQGQREVKKTQFYGVAGDPVFNHTIVQSRYESNRPLICETLMNVSHKYAAGEAEKLDLAAFFEWYFVGLLEAESHGTNISAAAAELDAAIATLPPSDQETVKRKISVRRERKAQASPFSIKHAILVRIQQLLARSALWEGGLASLARRFGVDMNGPKAGISDIGQFTKLTGRLFYRVQAAEH